MDMNTPWVRDETGEAGKDDGRRELGALPRGPDVLLRRE